jgi:hypothetical protein
MLWLCFSLVAMPANREANFARIVPAPARQQASSDKPQSQTSQSQGSSSKRPQSSDSTDDSPNAPTTPAKLLKWEYEATLKDIDKLVKLSSEIREDMEKAGENVLPLATLKKLDELERLTRKIRGRIKQ